MEITKVVKPFIRRGANTFGNIVYIWMTKNIVLVLRQLFAKCEYFELNQLSICSLFNINIVLVLSTKQK